MKTEKKQPHHRLKKFIRLHLWLLGSILVILVLVRLILPFGVKAYVNHQLGKSVNYTGKIGDVHVHLWRGAYSVQAMEFYKRNGAVKEPLFAADDVDFSVEWKELFHGSLVGEIALKRPRLNFVSGPTDEQSQSGKDGNWNEIITSLFPFNFNRVQIADGQLHFQNHFSTPPVDIYFDNTFVNATNLSNSRGLKQPLPAGVQARAKTLGGGKLDVGIQLDSLTTPPQFELTASLTNVDLVALNDFMKAYGKFDVDHGQFALFTSIAAKEGNYNGYAKVFFDDLDVFQWEKERKKNALEIFWQAIVGTLAATFKNHTHDQLATKIPIEGSYGKTSIGIWGTIGSLLQNAFIRALIPKIDNKVTVKEVPKPEQAHPGGAGTNAPPALPPKEMESGKANLKR